MGKVTFGIYSSPVVSGHMLMYVAVLSMIFQQRRINFFAIFLTLLLLIGSFATQERTGFYTAIAMILFLMYIKITLMNNSSKYFLIFLFIVGVLLFIPWFFNMLMEGESRYAEKGFDTTGRDVIYLESFNYFLDHPLLGGYYNYMESHTFPPHNVLLNSLVYSGVLGTFFIISIFGIRAGSARTSMSPQRYLSAISAIPKRFPDRTFSAPCTNTTYYIFSGQP